MLAVHFTPRLRKTSSAHAFYSQTWQIYCWWRKSFSSLSRFITNHSSCILWDLEIGGKIVFRIPPEDVFYLIGLHLTFRHTAPETDLTGESRTLERAANPFAWQVIKLCFYNWIVEFHKLSHFSNRLGFALQYYSFWMLKNKMKAFNLIVN